MQTTELAPLSEGQRAHSIERVTSIAKLLKNMLLNTSPFHGYVLNWLCHLNVSDQCPTACTDGDAIYYNPAFMDTLTDDQVRFVILHEMYHVIFMHTIRASKIKNHRNQRLWNEACDYVVNYELSYINRFHQFKANAASGSKWDITFDIPDGALLARDAYGKVIDLGNYSAEDIYEYLIKEDAKSSESSGGTNQSAGVSTGSSSDQEQSSSSENTNESASTTQAPKKISFDPPEDNEEDNSNGNSTESSEDDSNATAGTTSGTDDEGSEEGNNAAEAQSGNSNCKEEGFTDLMPQHAEKTEQIAEHVKRVLKQAKMKKGTNIGAGLSGFIENVFKKTNVRWDIYLRKFLTAKISDEDSYDTPNKKYLPYEMIVPGPGSYKEQLDDVFIFFDTSGSISTQEMMEMLNNAYTICTSYDCTLSCAFWHIGVYGEKQNITPDDFAKQLSKIDTQSGGTDVGCVFKYIEENRLKSTAFLIFTDGCFDKVPVPKRISRKTIIALEEDAPPYDWLPELGKVVSYRKKK